MSDEADEAVRNLSSSRSPVRRSAAKKLRRLRVRGACAELARALHRELLDVRTWETQYQMIMALAETGCRDVLPVLEAARARAMAPMVFVALGDAWVRLKRRSEHDVAPALDLISSGDLNLVDGAFRAVAMLRLRPSDEDMRTMVAFASALPSEDPRRFWLAAAAAGWIGSEVSAFLEQCRASRREDIRRIADSSSRGEYALLKHL